MVILIHFLSTTIRDDIINGGAGADRLFQSQDPRRANPLTSDGFKDSLNCGPGDDIAYINRTIDHDRAINCEHINPTLEN